MTGLLWRGVLIGSACGALACAAAPAGPATGSGSGGEAAGSGGGAVASGAGGGAVAVAVGAGGSAASGSGGGLGFDPNASVCDVAAEQQADATCKVTVTIDSLVVSSSSCFVDSPLVQGAPGELGFACGDGPATLTFPGGVFVGTASSCNLDLKLTTQFDYVDGCTWQTSQTIVGPMEGDLTYTYTEAPIIGTSCASPCTIDAKLSLEQSGPVEVEPPS